MLLTLVVFSPLAGAALVALLPREEVRGIRRAALAFALVTLVLSLEMLRRFQVGVASFQMAEQVAWIPQWGIEYRLGVDGVSLFLVLLTTVLTPIVVLASWGDIHRRVKEFFAFLLVLETGMLGTLVALDMFLFYVFWEVMLVPMYFLIGVWGGPRRIYAALKFVLFTMAGSLLMLVAILYCAWRVPGTTSFAYETWLARLALSPRDQLWLFAAFALAFAIRCRSSRSTPGSPTRTSRRRPAARSSWRACCSRWGPTASSASRCPSSRARWRRRRRSWSPSPSPASSTARWWRRCSPT